MSVGGYVLGGVGLLVVVRFLFGMGEAGAYPNITRALHNWFPCQQRGFAQGAVWMSRAADGRPDAAGLDGAGRGHRPLGWPRQAAPRRSGRSAAASALAGRLLGVRPGGRGVVLFFALWFRNRPEEKPAVNAAELAWIRSGGAESAAAHAGIPWRHLLTSRNLWALCLMYACQSYGWYFYITYLPDFLERHYNVSAGTWARFTREDRCGWAPSAASWAGC